MITNNQFRNNNLLFQFALLAHRNVVIVIRIYLRAVVKHIG